MAKHPKIVAGALGIAFAVVAFASGIVLAFGVGMFTNSGLLGSCGPYGPAAGLIGWIVVGSLLLGTLAGVFGARYCYGRRIRKQMSSAR